MRITAAAILPVLAAAHLCAHEIGTTRVSVLLKQDRTFEISVITDAGTLIDKLQGRSGASPTTQLLATHDNLFRQRVNIAFDGVEVHPAISYSVTPAPDALSAPAAAIRFTGPIPEGAHHMTWLYAWTFASYAITVQHAGPAPPSTTWLEGAQMSEPLDVTPLSTGSAHPATALRYLALGFTHILPHGFDHMLFVLGIFLLTRRTRAVLMQVSAFTLAHSITLGLSMYGFIAVSPRVVEPAIAISIAYVAIENLFVSELKRWRVALVFGFGLLHGMGFAGALREVGLPRSEFLVALLTFNAGVEAAQLAVIAAAFLVVGWHCGNRPWYRNRIVMPASVLIACIALCWTFERISL